MLGVVNVVQGTKVRHAVYICGLKDILGVADPCVQVHAGQVLLELPVPLQTLSRSATTGGAVQCHNSLPDNGAPVDVLLPANAPAPSSLTSTIPLSMQGSRMLTPESDYSLTLMLNISSAATDAPSDSLSAARSTLFK